MDLVFAKDFIEEGFKPLYEGCSDKITEIYLHITEMSKAVSSVMVVALFGSLEMSLVPFKP